MSALKMFLMKIPFLNNVIAFFTGKARLLIEYGLILILVVLASTCFTLWLKERALQKDVAAMNRIVGGMSLTIEDQNDSILALVAARERDSKAIDDLLLDFETIANDNRAFETKLKELEKSNETVKSFLATELPPELKCLLQPARCNGVQSSGTQSKSIPAKAAPKGVQ